MRRPNLWMVFDVESVGLHGEGFAFGAVVVDSEGKELLAVREACGPDQARGTADGRQWVSENVPGMPRDVATARAVRDCFWDMWMEQRAAGAVLAADVAWPVESRFLFDCIGDDPVGRAWLGPYPLVDVASVRLAAGLDPLGTEERRPNELPAHDPLADARQSARLLIEALRGDKP